MTDQAKENVGAGEPGAMNWQEFLDQALADIGPDDEDETPHPPIQVTKHAAYVQMPDETAMDYGLIPDTRPPMVLTRRQRWRYARQEWTRKTRWRVGVAVGSWITGVQLGEEEDW